MVESDSTWLQYCLRTPSCWTFQASRARCARKSWEIHGDPRWEPSMFHGDPLWPAWEPPTVWWSSAIYGRFGRCLMVCLYIAHEQHWHGIVNFTNREQVATRERCNIMNKTRHRSNKRRYNLPTLRGMQSQVSLDQEADHDHVLWCTSVFTHYDFLWFFFWMFYGFMSANW